MIIAIDLDDTLLNSKREISEFNKKAIAEAQKQGHKIAVLTLRSIVRCERLAKEINADFICAFLGNMIYDSSKRKVVFSRPLEIDTFENVIAEGKKIINSWIGFEAEHRSCIDDKRMLEIYDNVDFVEPDVILNEIKNHKVFKLSFGLEKQESLVPKFKELSEKFGCDNVVSKHFNFFDLFAKNTNKVNALKWLKENYPNEKIIMFGDSMPDAQSLKFADIGVAVANASDEVKKYADAVTDSNDEDGVGKYILKLLNNN